MGRIGRILAGLPAPGFGGYALTEHALKRAFERLARGRVELDDMCFAVTRPQVVRHEGDRCYQQYGTVGVVVNHAQRVVITVWAVGEDAFLTPAGLSAF